jgi:hypothetical protein
MKQNPEGNASPIREWVGSREKRGLLDDLPPPKRFAQAG